MGRSRSSSGTDRRLGPTVLRHPSIERRGRPRKRPASVERRLVLLLRPYWRQILTGLGVTVGMTLLGLAKPWPMKILIDSVFGPHELAGLSRDGALAVSVGLTMALFLLSGALGLLQTRVLMGLGQDLIANLRRETYSHATRLSLGFHNERSAADSVYRLANDTYAVQSVLLDGVVPLVAALMTLGGTLAVMLTLDVELTFLALASVPFAALATRRFTGRIRVASLGLRDREAAVYAHAEQTLGDIRVVQAFGREGYESSRFAERAQASRDAYMSLTQTQVLFGLAVDLILSAGLGAVTWVAAKHALAGGMTPGEVLVFVAYAGSLYGPVSGMAAIVRELQHAAASAQRVFELLDEPWLDRGLDKPVPAPRAHGELTVRDVRFSYTPQRRVLWDISFTARPGELIALVGPTGAGKSTLMSLLLRLHDPTEGRIEIDGIDLRDVPLPWLREQIALVPQEPTLFPASVRDNIRYGRLDATDEEVERAAAAAKILDELRDDPRGLDAPLGDGGITLSGGQRQRVAIARALLADPRILILDDATSSVDARTEAAIKRGLREAMAGRTTFIVAHRMSTISLADEVVVMDGGRIVDRGGHEELLERSPLYAEIADHGCEDAVFLQRDLEAREEVARL